MHSFANWSPSPRMANPRVESLLVEAGAIMQGHFLLTSGRHSDVYVEKFRILERPDVVQSLATEIAAFFASHKVSHIAGPTTGGILIAFEVARQMGLPSLYIETEDGHKTLRRNASVPTGARVGIVDDVLTTGRSVVESIDAISRLGGEVVAVGVLIDRTETDPGFGVPWMACHQVSARSYPANEVPDWLAEIPIRKPGTRA